MILGKMRLISKITRISVILIFLSNNICYGLAALPASQNVAVKRKIMSVLQRHRAKYASSDYDKTLLKVNDDKILLLRDGRFLVDKSLEGMDDISFFLRLRAKEYEAFLHILQIEEPGIYRKIFKIGTKYLPVSEGVISRKMNKTRIEKMLALFLSGISFVADGIAKEDDLPYDVFPFSRAAFRELSAQPLAWSDTFNYINVNYNIEAWMNEGKSFFDPLLPADVKNYRNNKLIPYSGRTARVGKTAPLYLKKNWIDVFNEKAEGKKIKQIDIIAAGGGGDALGCAFHAIELKKIFGDDVKITIVTSNLKRGHENPPGGPLKMQWMIDPAGRPVSPLKEGIHIYPVRGDFKIQVPLTDSSGKVIPGYEADVELSEVKIVDVLNGLGIDMVMADVGQSGQALAKSYIEWRGESIKNTFVIEADMGGDILARFPGKITDRSSHPETKIASPNTDAIFLDMAVELEESGLLDGRVLLTVSAPGGDGELEETLLQYLRDFYEQGEVEGILDNVRFLVEMDPSGSETRNSIEKCLEKIFSEVSGPLVWRVLAAANILPLLDKKIAKGSEKYTANWMKAYSEIGRLRGFEPEELIDPEIMCSEIKIHDLSRQKIRGGTRTVVLPWLYTSSIFLKPSAVANRILDTVMADTSLTWMEKNDYLVESLNYRTEMGDPNNVRDRALTNSYLLKARILEKATKAAEKDGAQDGIGSHIKEILDNLPPAAYPEVRDELRALCPVFDTSFSYIILKIVNRFSSSEADRKKFDTVLREWLTEKQKKVLKDKDLSFYLYAYFGWFLLEKTADFVIKTEGAPHMDVYMKTIEDMFNVVKKITAMSKQRVLPGIIVEKVMPAVLSVNNTGKSGLAEYLYKANALISFLETVTSGEVEEDLLKFVEDVLPGILSLEYRDEEYLLRIIHEIYDFSKIPRVEAPVRFLAYNKIFMRIFPGVLKACNEQSSLKRVFQILDQYSDELMAGEIPYTYYFCFLDFLGELVSREKMITSVDDIEKIDRLVKSFRVRSSMGGKDFSSLLRLLIYLSKKLDTVDQIVEAGLMLKNAVDQYLHSGDELVGSFGIRYNLDEATRKDINEMMEMTEGAGLIAALQKINISIVADSITDLERDFNDVERGYFERIQKLAAEKTDEEINQVQGVKSIEPLRGQDQVREEMLERYQAQGIRVMKDGKCAFGITAGLLSNNVQGLMDVDFLLNIPGTDSIARRFIEWKFYMLSRMNDIYGLQATPVPAVVMTGFSSATMEDVLFWTRNFGYGLENVFTFYQGPTKTVYAKPYLTKSRGDIVKLSCDNDKSHEFFASPGSWGFIKWLIISGTLKRLKDRGVKYLTHSSVNNPMEGITPKMLGFFDKLVTGKKGTDAEPLVLIEFTEYDEQSSAMPVILEYPDGRKESRVLHKDRLPEDFKNSIVPEDNLASLSNMIINLDKLWRVFGMDELYKDGAVPERGSLVEKVHACEDEKGIEPVVRRRTMPDGREILVEYFRLENITQLGPWVPVKVKESERHYIPIKSPGDKAFRSKIQIMRKRFNDLEVGKFRKSNANTDFLINYLTDKGIVGVYGKETVETIINKVVGMFLHNRIFEEREDLAHAEYLPGAYRQADIKDTPEEIKTKEYRMQLVARYITRLCELYPHREREKSDLISETMRVMRSVLGFNIGNGRLLGNDITNAESNIIARQCIKLVFFGKAYFPRFNPFSSINRLSNDLVISRLSEKGDRMSTDQLLREAVNSDMIKTYFQERAGETFDFLTCYEDIFDEMDICVKNTVFKVDASKEFIKRVSKGKIDVVYIPDDNGEVVYHLYLIQRFMKKNPDLKVTMIPRGAQYSVDVSYNDIIQLLEYPIFSELKAFFEMQKFKVLEHSPRLGGIDLKRVSREVRNAIKDCNFLFSVGCINFEMLNGVIRENYHMLKVNGSTSQISTGFEAGDCIFVRHFPGDIYINQEAFINVSRKYGAQLEDDVENTTTMLMDVLNSKFKDDQIFTISYDLSRLSPDQVQVIEQYLRLLQDYFNTVFTGKKIKIKPNPFVGNDPKKDSLVSVRYLNNKGVQGEGEIFIKEDEPLINQVPLIRLLNIAFAVSNIPYSVSSSDLQTAEYSLILGFIEKQYKAVTGEDIREFSDDENLLDYLRQLSLDLPDALAMPAEKQREYNELAMKMLISA